MVSCALPLGLVSGLGGLCDQCGERGFGPQRGGLCQISPWDIGY